MPLICDDILQVRMPAICFYVLRATDGLYLIDAGFVGGRSVLRRALHGCGWQNQKIRGIIVTHGHLDHVLNVARLARETSAWVAAPRLDAPHYQGAFHYTGAARICGLLEAIGRKVFHYEPFNVDHWLDDASELNVWDGLTAIHLPGHTIGHTGFYCRKRRLFFCGDMFKSRGFARFPHNILNSAPAQMLQSVQKALKLEVEGILPNHCDTAAPAEHLNRLRQFVQKAGGERF